MKRIVFGFFGILWCLVGASKQWKARGKDIYSYIDGTQMYLIGIMWIFFST